MIAFVSDGFNYRLINRTGGPQGAIMTTLGSGYTSPPTVVEATTSGGSLWRAIVGGAINTTVTVTAAGKYNYVPMIVFPQAPAGGITPTAIAVISAGAISSVTVKNRGAGLAVAPVGTLALTSAQAQQFNWSTQGNRLVVVQDPRDTAAGGAVLTVNQTLAGSGAVTAVICTDPGSAPVTALPTLVFSGGGGASAAADVIMNWTVTGLTVGTGGAAYGTSLPFIVEGTGLLNASVDASGDVNPAHNLGIVTPRNFRIAGTSTGGGAATATGAVIEDAGFGIQRVPEANILTGQITTTAGAATVAVGGTPDTCWLQQTKN